MKDKKYDIKILKEIIKRTQDDIQNVYTPLELCEEMIEKLPDLNKEEKILLMFNIEFIYVIREKLGKENMDNVWFYTGNEIKKRTAIQMGVNENHIIFNKYKYKNIDIKINMKFDIVIGNPPFQNGKNHNFYVEFYKIIKKIISDNGIFMFISPNRFLVTGHIANKILLKHFNPTYVLHRTNYFKDVKTSIGYFIASPSTYQHKTIIQFKDKQIETDISILPTSMWDDTFISKQISDKIFSKFPKICFDNENKGGFFISRQMKRWNATTEIGGAHVLNIMESDIKGHNDGKWVNVPKNEIETAKWFLTKSKIMRFLTAIYMGMNTPPLFWKLTPSINFSKSWNDDKLYKYFNLKDEEIEYIENQIKIWDTK